MSENRRESGAGCCDGMPAGAGGRSGAAEAAYDGMMGGLVLACETLREVGAAPAAGLTHSQAMALLDLVIAIKGETKNVERRVIGC